jgi:hypothetical protein
LVRSARHLWFLLVVACARGAPLEPSPGDAGGAMDAPAVGDGPPVVPAVTLPDSRYGSRLRRRRWTTPEGVEGTGGIQDDTLGGECQWRPTADGKYRCLPVGSVIYPIQFADSQCTQLADSWIRQSCGAPTEYLLTPSAAATCPASFGVRKRGSKLDVRAFHERLADGSCGSTPVPLPPAEDLYAVGAELPLDGFVAAIRTADPPAFGPVYLDAEDGSRWSYGFRDPASGTDCSFATAADGMARCVPVTAAGIQGFGDGSCTTPAVVGFRSSCPVEATLLQGSNTGMCSTGLSVFRAAARLPSAFRKSKQSCEPMDAPAYLDVFSIGAELDPAGFALASSRLLDGPGRLLRRALSTPAGTIALGSLWDSQLGVDCARHVLPDGTNRCVPNSAFASVNFYTDPACTRPLAIASPPGCSTPPYLLRPVLQSCPRAVRVFALAPQPYRGDFYVDSGTACVKSAAFPPGGSELREIGAELPADAFVELHLPP